MFLFYILSIYILSGLENTGAEPRFCQGWGEWADSEAESCWRRKVELHEWSELSAAGSWGPLGDPAGFWVFNAQLCILPHSLILTSSSSPPKADKIVYVLHCTSINLWYFDILHQQGSHLTWKTWKTWKNESTPGKLEISWNFEKFNKYHGKWHETWKNLVATKHSPLTPLKQYKIH